MKKKRVSFIIYRLAFLKTLGAVIDECLSRGHYVNIIYDAVGKYSKSGKTELDQSSFSIFKYGNLNLIPLIDINNLHELICPITDVLVHQGFPLGYNQNTIQEIDQYKIIKKKGVPQVGIMSHFYDNCILELENYEFFDKTCVLSKFSLEAHQRILLNTCSDKNERVYLKEKIQKVFSNVKITGSALFDYFNTIYNCSPLRSKKNIVFFAPKGFGHPFYDLVLYRKSKYYSFIKSILFYNGMYRKQIFHEPSLVNFLKILYKFSINNNLDLIIKSRPKHKNDIFNKHKSYYTQMIDGSDDSFYPNYTTADLLQNARLAINTRTFSVLEAVVAGVPAIYFQIPITSKNNAPFDTELMNEYVKIVRSSSDNSLFNYTGCVWKYSWKESINILNNLKVNDFIQDPNRRKEYVKYYCGIDERPAAQKQADLIDEFL